MNELSTTDQRLTPATTAEISAHLHSLFSGLPIRGGSDPNETLKTYIIALQGYPEWAIGAAVRAFLRGQVEGQSMSYCPRPPELATAVRRELQPVYDEIERNRLFPPRYNPPAFDDGLAPFERLRNKLLAEHANRPLLYRNVSLGEWQKLCATRQIPTGSVWVAALGIIFGPETASA